LKLTYPSCGVACAKDIEELIRTTTTGRIAGFLAEPIQGVGGFITPPPEYFEIAVKIIRKYGGVFICDEVQTGFGRTGGKFWGIEHWGVEPDILTMAKGIANGLPLGATIATPEIAASLKALTISTFGGNPVSCAAGVAVAETMLAAGFLDEVKDKGDYLAAKLGEIAERYPQIAAGVRGMGLIQGLLLTPAYLAQGPEIVNQLFTAGILANFAGNVALRFLPPLVVSREEIDLLAVALDNIFGEMA
jgi:4-aminobutyrate aminotransferase-like enzyme